MSEGTRNRWPPIPVFVRWILFGLILGIALGGSLTWTPGYAPCPQDNGERNTCDSDGSKDQHHSVYFVIGNWTGRNHSTVEALGVVATAMFTLALFVSTAALWGVTERTLSHAETNSKLELRAYVSLESANVEAQNFSPDGLGPVNYTCDIMWTNTGKTPARKAISRLNRTSEIIGDDFQFPESTDSDYRAIGPGQSIRNSYLMSIDEMSRIYRKEQRLFMWASVEYDDVFKESPRRRSEASFELFVTTDPKLLGAVVGLNFHGKRFNAMDEDCFKQPLRREQQV